MSLLFFFFFPRRRRHTRCLSDWISGVCSSDLLDSTPPAHSMSALRGGQPQPRHRMGRRGRVEALLRASVAVDRSEERRVGKEGRSRGWPYHLKKKKKRRRENV